MHIRVYEIPIPKRIHGGIVSNGLQSRERIHAPNALSGFRKISCNPLPLLWNKERQARVTSVKARAGRGTKISEFDEGGGGDHHDTTPYAFPLP